MGKWAALSVLIGVCFFTLSHVLLVERLRNMGVTTTAATDYLESNHHVTVSPAMKEMAYQSGALGPLLTPG